MEQKVQPKPSGRAMRIIRNIYLYLVTLVGLITFIVGSVGLINDLLQRYVFQVNNYNVAAPAIYPGYTDQCSTPYASPVSAPDKTTMIVPTTQQIAECRQAQTEQNQQQNDSQFGRDLSIALAQILIGLPIWLFHWNIIQGENRKREEELDEK